MAHAHTSTTTITWLKNNVEHYIPPEYWPPKSPDLSPIKNVWSIMSATACLCQTEPRTLTALKRRLRKSSTSISLTTVQNLISLMPGRLKAVIRDKGDTDPS